VRILREVDLIAAEDTRTTKVLLDHYEISRPMVSFFSHNEAHRAPQLIDRLRAGQSVALVSDAGTPGISDPAFAIVRLAVQNGIRIVPVPGPAALVAALVASGLPMDRFVFEGFLPLKKGRRTKLESLRSEPRTIILYESPHRILKTLGEIAEHLGNRNVVIARELTKKFEEFVRGPVSEVLSQFQAREPRGEFVILIEGAPRHPAHDAGPV
jgi:16S rRNA (cytidine1402-2'-O)-methyltransferase